MLLLLGLHCGAAAAAAASKLLAGPGARVSEHAEKSSSVSPDLFHNKSPILSSF